MHTVVIMVCVSLCFALVWGMRRKQLHLWLGSYVTRRLPPKPKGPVHVLFCFVDHFEPQWGKPSYEVEVARVSAWRERYATLAAKHRDADGKPPVHSFFYPEEEYRPEHLDQLVALCRDGYGEIEVHLHHDRDTADGLRRKISGFVETLRVRHDAISVNPSTGRPMFGFIHGNWALDNSRPDGRCCGVNNELQVLSELGCYADFTLPSAPSDMQTHKINSIYYATDDPDRPKSHDDGVDVEVGRPSNGDLLLVQGPLALNWKRPKWGLLPRIENADIQAASPPSKGRVDLWIRQHIHVLGRPDWVFVKIHTHGTQEGSSDTLLGDPVDRMFSYLESAYNDGENYVLHYVSAREVYNIVKAAEAGHSGSPSPYRDFILPRPGYRN